MPQASPQGLTQLPLNQAREITDLLDLLVEIALVHIVESETLQTNSKEGETP
ncbi:MAG: hypothetical protein FD187_2726 [bacterium]|nr:MAG: hypothetical protein FD142_3004 [bacterium]KAF0147506.1 MAG: hypothetical protein FD187_2726 [bacterium]KAF0165678.1 MAG: hypothetical protein FD158_2842 [bacterium]TXT19294.1 MAG: hypothetical protein FD132_1804 [bacterium]